jgi:riboflavin kinase/FMN adenylyltransferase
MTFEPHPAAILHPEKAPGVLTPLGLKTHLLAKYGLDCLIVLKDSRELMNLSPAKFVEEFLATAVQPAVVVEGENFNFGCGRTGNVHTLRNLGLEKGFEVTVIETEEVKLSIGQALNVSSTLIRNLLEAGKVTDAAVALGRPYRLIGKVIKGRGKGTELGFPTANMAKSNQLVPAESVYAGLVEIGDSAEQVCETTNRLPAALSIGRLETLGGDNPLAIEAHILTETVGDLHGKWLAMDFAKHLRNQIKFDSEKELAEQIAKDCEQVKKILKSI